MGRPPVEEPAQKKSISFDPESLKKLETYCENHNVTRSEAVRRGLVLLFEQEEQQQG